jgi:hypothetical protein
MVSKLDLVSVISKYYLNGMNEAVRWEIKDETVNIKFTSPAKEMIGSVVFKGMPLEDSTVAISNTTQLIKLLSITSGNLELKLDKIKSVFTRLHIADSNFDLTYSLILKSNLKILQLCFVSCMIQSWPLATTTC